MHPPATSSGKVQCPLQLQKYDLPIHRQRLVELMQRINFGRIEGLVVREKQPVLEPPPVIIREVKFGGENGPRPEVHAEDFLLKTQVVKLFAALDELCDGIIDGLDVKHGLPFRMLVREAAN